MARDIKQHDMASPVDLPGRPIVGRDPLGWTTITIGVASLLLLCANAGTLTAWIDEKPPSELQQQASDLAHRWEGMMDAIGVTAPRETLHRWWKQAQAARFGDEAPGETP
jgi:hypothetical protein